MMTRIDAKRGGGGGGGFDMGQKWGKELQKKKSWNHLEKVSP